MLDAGLAGRFEHRQGAGDVGARVVQRALDRGHDVAEAAEVEDVVGALEERASPAGSVAMSTGGTRSRGSRRCCARLSSRPVFRLSMTRDLEAAVEQQVHHVAADEAGPAGDDARCAASLRPAPSAWTVLTLIVLGVVERVRDAAAP